MREALPSTLHHLAAAPLPLPPSPCSHASPRHLAPPPRSSQQPHEGAGGSDSRLLSQQHQQLSQQHRQLSEQLRVMELECTDLRQALAEARAKHGSSSGTKGEEPGAFRLLCVHRSAPPEILSQLNPKTLLSPCMQAAPPRPPPLPLPPPTLQPWRPPAPKPRRCGPGWKLPRRRLLPPPPPLLP